MEIKYSSETLYKEHFNISAAMDQLEQWTTVYGGDYTYSDVVELAHRIAERESITTWNPSF